MTRGPGARDVRPRHGTRRGRSGKLSGAAFTRLLAGEDQREVAADLRRQARRTYDRLERGLAGYRARGA